MCAVLEGGGRSTLLPHLLGLGRGSRLGSCLPTVLTGDGEGWVAAGEFGRAVLLFAIPACPGQRGHDWQYHRSGTFTSNDPSNTQQLVATNRFNTADVVVQRSECALVHGHLDLASLADVWTQLAS